MPFDPASVHPASFAAAPIAAAFRVLPCIDASSGAVLLFVGGSTERYRCAHPDRLTSALSQAVRPAVWFPAERRLLLAVAARGYRDGKELYFTLE